MPLPGDLRIYRLQIVFPRLDSVSRAKRAPGSPKAIGNFSRPAVALVAAPPYFPITSRRYVLKPQRCIFLLIPLCFQLFNLIISLPLFPVCWLDEAVLKKLLEVAREESDTQTQHHERIEKFKAECDKLGLTSFTEAIAKADNTIADVKDAFEKGFYAQWIIPALDKAPSLQNFRRRVHEQHLEKFTELDESQFGIARSRIRNKIIKTFPDQYSATGPRSEIGILKHEMEKKLRIMR